MADPAASLATGEVFATVSGRGSPPVLLLHGQPGTGADWDRVAPLLVDRYCVVVPDRPGYGRTGGRATGFSGNAAALVALLDRLGIERTVLVGHSWGGGVAISTVARHPDRVSGLVLVSSVGPGEYPGWGDRLLATPVLGELLAGVTIGAAELLVNLPKVQEVATRRLAGRPRDAMISLSRRPGSRSWVWRSFAIEQRALLSELWELAGTLGRIDVPAAVVHGRADHLVPVSVAEHLADAIPGATLTVLPRVGHLLPYDRPDAVARAVHEIVARGEDQTAR